MSAGEPFFTAMIKKITGEQPSLLNNDQNIPVVLSEGDEAMKKAISEERAEIGRNLRAARLPESVISATSVEPHIKPQEKEVSPHQH